MSDHRPITRVLVANRGEIARRVFRSCRELGIATAAVYSDADAGAPHVLEADVAVRLPGNAPGETYLRGELLIDAARRAGADAIHPGYGFLSESAGFARAVIQAGLTWIGPSPDAIDAMGDKIEAKRLMAAAGVPVLEQLQPDAVTEAQLPVLIKASAGGGGRGMRIVRDLRDLDRELEAARAEAASAFGDPTVFCEPYLAAGRHIEVQILADEHGTVWTVGERECSIQRRHQKVIEEAPSPLVERLERADRLERVERLKGSGAMRERLFDAAQAAAKAIGYTSAGTVEFLADEDGRFYFLEMNTRLQVEHPVTECTTGLDLVALQVAIAEGVRLGGESPAIQGHSIEARLYAEDPGADWQPQSGVLHRIDIPGVDTRFDLGSAAAGLRLDSGVEDGSAVSIHYDPMLAKVISWAPTRAQAAAVLAAALHRMTLHGLVTNRDLLVNVLRHPAFLAGDTDTGFFDKHGLKALAAAPGGERAERLSALAAVLACDARARATASVLPGIPSGWRNVVSQPQVMQLEGASPHRIAYRLTRDGLVAQGYAGVELIAAGATEVVLDVDGLRRSFSVARYEGRPHDIHVDSALGAVHLVEVERFPDPADDVAAGSLLAPMPGTVVRIAASLGDQVTAGQPILWLEAMKMQHQINAPTDGLVSELPVRAGQQVDVGEILAVVTAQEGTP